MAHAAACCCRGSWFDLQSLFFYGGVGLGKTHLMHIGHQMLVNQPDAKVKYVSSETFTNEFINSIQTKTSEQFRKEYRNVDLLWSMIFNFGGKRSNIGRIFPYLQRSLQ